MSQRFQIVLCKTVLVFLLFPVCLRAGQTEAERIKRGYELSAEKWVLETKLAANPEQRQALADSRPDAGATATALWDSIAPSLAEPWSVPYSAFFLNLTRDLTAPDNAGINRQAFVEQRKQLIGAFERQHLKSPGIAPFCSALIGSKDPRSIPILEKIAATHPEESTQGIAALCAALMLKHLGDDPEVMKKRLGFLRQAIIMSADKSVGGRSVADIATDELYIIRFLTKGRIAPPLSGTDVGDRVVKLEDFRGRIVVLLFWDAKSTETDRIIGLTNQLVSKYHDRPVTVLGVTPESIERIRTLQADGSILWNNIYDPADKLASDYRISSRPAVLVLDQSGTIQFTGLPGSFVELTVDALLNPEN